MDSADLDDLISTSDKTLQGLARYNQTGQDLQSVIRSIRVLTAPLVIGTEVAPDFINVTRAVDRHDLIVAVFGLYRATTFSRGQRCIELQGYVNKVHSALLAYKQSVDAATMAVQRRVFYSWQSNLPNTDNRGFISACLERAVKEINASLQESDRQGVPLELDRDTQGVAGSPDIFDSILQKIDQSGVFVADVTLLAKGQSNSNVMVELGYALAKLGKGRILMIFNEAYGSGRDAPFDLGFKRLITYKYKKSEEPSNIEDAKKSEERKALTGKVQHHLREIIGD